MQTPPCHIASRQGFAWICCFLAQVTSSQDLLQGFCAAAWQWREGIKDQQFIATKSKGCLASDKDLSIQVQECVIVFAAATHIVKLERYREDQHGPCTTITRKFVKRSKFLAISSHHTDTPLPQCQYVGLSGNLLSAGSSYIVQTTAAHVALPTDSMRSVCLHLRFILLKIWNVSRIYISSLRRSQANLFCIVPILIYVFCRKALTQFAPGQIIPCHEQGSL